MALLLLLAFPGRVPEARAGGIDLHATLVVPGADVREFTVHAWVQGVDADSLDLVRAPVPGLDIRWIEARIGMETHMLYAAATRAGVYRTALPRNAPLIWTYSVKLAEPDARARPVVLDSTCVCAWTGALLAVPRPATSAAGARYVLARQPDRLRAGIRVPADWEVFTPWPRAGDALVPETVDDLVDAFVAAGDWRLLAGDTSATRVFVHAIDPERAAAAWARVEPVLGAGGKAPRLVCMVSGPELRLWRARSSALVVWPPGTVAARDAIRAALREARAAATY